MRAMLYLLVTLLVVIVAGVLWASLSAPMQWGVDPDAHAAPVVRAKATMFEAVKAWPLLIAVFAVGAGLTMSLSASTRLIVAIALYVLGGYWLAATVGKLFLTFGLFPIGLLVFPDVANAVSSTGNLRHAAGNAFVGASTMLAGWLVIQLGSRQDSQRQVGRATKSYLLRNRGKG